MFEKNFFRKINNSSKESPKEMSILGNIRNKLNSRNLVLTMAFVSSLSNVAKAKEINKDIEVKGFKSEVINSPDKVEFQAVNYFASDSDYISKKAKEKIGNDFKKLLHQVNEDNYKDIIKDGVYVYSSADPEKTNNFKDNEELSRARAESLIKILKEYLDNLDFSNLSPEKSKEFKDNIKFFIEIPTSSIVSNPQVGVIYPEDLGYSKEVLSKMSQDEMDEIYTQCRKVVVSLGVYKSDTYYVSNKDFINNIQPKDLLDKDKKVIDGRVKWDAENIVILVDNSPSVGDYSYKEVLSKIMNDPELIGKKIQFSFFSKDLDENIICEDVREVISLIEKEKFAGDIVEQVLSSSLSKIKALPTPESERQSTIMKSFTDENLQNVSLDMINSFIREASIKRVDAKFYYVDKENGLMQISTEELKIAIEKQFLINMEGVLKTYISNKNNEIRNINKNQRGTIKQQLDDLSIAYNSNNLSEVFGSPLFNEMYPGYRNPKDVLLKQNIPIVSLKNIGHRASTSDGNLVYNQKL